MDNQDINPSPTPNPTPMPDVTPAAPVAPEAPMDAPEAAPVSEPTTMEPAATEPATVEPSVAETPNVAAAPVAAAPVETAAPAEPAKAPAAVPDGRERKKPKIGLIIGIVVGILVLIGAIVGLVMLISNLGGSDDESIYDSNAFFLKNDDGLFALFNDDGERLTEFEYGYAGSIIGGTALVRDADNDKSGIINSEGKMIVGFDKYRFITRMGALYEASDDDLNDSLINGNGKKLYDLGKNKLVTYDDSFAVVADEKGFQVLNYQGKNILSITKNLDQEIHLSSERESFVVIAHAGTNYVINALKGAIVTQFESKQNYEVYMVDKDDDIIFLRSRDSDETDTKFIVKGEYMGAPGGCENVNYYSMSKTLTCSKDGKTFVLTGDFKIGIETTGTQYISDKTYAKNKEDSDNYGVNFYKDGTKVASVDCRTVSTTGKVSGDLYLLYTRYTSQCRKDGITSGHYEYYTADGKLAFGRDFSSASTFSVSGLARIREIDSNDYSLINTKGEKVGNSYRTLGERSSDEFKYYYGYNSYGDEVAVMNHLGKQIAKTSSYSYLSADTYDDKLYIYVKNDDQYEIYRAEDGTKLTTSTDYPSFTDHYIKTTGKDKVRYFTYEGKQFHEHKS